MAKLTPFLWFDADLREVYDYYARIFPGTRRVSATEAPEGVDGGFGPLTLEFEILGQRFAALNGGRRAAFTEAVSLAVTVDTQEEVDRYWDALTADGGEESMCGWLKDRYGLSWQITPVQLLHGMSNPDPAVAARVARAMMTMRKIVIADVEAAARG
ncbi:MAG TPA: VOC family protein [Naasia sp.]|jgi:predicted 3-demethylubiquinone-9 3-methyltransferase (glyoxalase superfamily)